MHLRLITFPSIHRLRSRAFTRVRAPVCSLSMRSSPGLTSLHWNSALSRGLPSPPSKALAPPTAVWAEAADLTSIGKLPAPGGFRPGAVGTGNRRGCRRIHPLEVGPIRPEPHPNAPRPPEPRLNDPRAAKDAMRGGRIFDTMSASYGLLRIVPADVLFVSRIVQPGWLRPYTTNSAMALSWADRETNEQ
jgi:hypothetical protein